MKWCADILNKRQILNIYYFSPQGDNILAVLKYLANSDIATKSQEYRHGNVVFFDVLGMFIVAYPARVGAIMNCIIASVAMLYLGKKVLQPRKRGKFISCSAPHTHYPGILFYLRISNLI